MCVSIYTRIHAHTPARIYEYYTNISEHNAHTTGTTPTRSSLQGKPGVQRFSPPLCDAGRTPDVSGFRPRVCTR